MFRNVYRIRIVGLNLDRLLNFIKNNYKAQNIVRVSYSEMVIDLSYNSYYNLLSKLDSSCYNIAVEKIYGIKNFASIMKRNFAFLLSLCICFTVALYFNTRLLRINIYGVDDDTYQNIMAVLKDNNIYKMGNNNININNIEQEILENVDTVSMVSVVVRGNVLLINAKEKLPSISNDYADFVAPYNLIIENIECYQGTLLKNNGDLVKKGEPIIGAYFVDGGEQRPIEPIYKLSASTYISDIIEFKQSEIRLERTGKKIINSCYNMFGYDFFNNEKECQFDFFEVETIEQNLFENMFLPLKVKKTIYYELEEVTYNYNFEEEKERLLLEGLGNAKSNILGGMQIVDSTQNVVNINNSVLIQTYLEVKVVLTND